MVNWFSARCFWEFYIIPMAQSNPNHQRTHRHFPAGRKADNTNTHTRQQRIRIPIRPAVPGLPWMGKVTDPCGWSMAGNQHGKSAFGKFSDSFQLWSERYPDTGNPRILPSPKKNKKKTTSAPRKNRGNKNMLKQENTLPWSMRWKLAWWWRWDQVS